MTTGETDLAKFMRFVLSKEGCDYCWPTKENGYSGKDLGIAKYKNVYDCSGLVTAAVYSITEGMENWRDWNAHKLYSVLPETTRATEGVLAFYGTVTHINHVMVMCADGRAFGARKGGKKVVTPEIAKQVGAGVMYASSHNYRKDFRGFRRLFDETEKLVAPQETK